MNPQPTACVIIIGNEILSGKTQDTNLQFIATRLASMGIRLERGLVIPDDEETIAQSVKQASEAFTYVFTTGGIGPTHDDITAECIAKAFGVELLEHEKAVELLTRRYQDELTPARRKMAMIPDGGSLIENPVSKAPGFRIENVFVLAGIPSIARAMFESLAPSLEGGDPIHSENVDGFLSEGVIAAGLKTLADEYPDVDIGSYPFFKSERYGVNVVVRGTDQALVRTVTEKVRRLIDELGGTA